MARIGRSFPARPILKAAGAPSGIQFDAATPSGYQTAQSTYTFSRTCTGSNRFLVVDVAILSVPGTTVSSVVDDTSGGNVAMSFIGARSTVSGAGRIEAWGLVAPATGTKTIRVTLSAAVASAAMAVSYTGVNQSAPTEAVNSAQATNAGAADATVTIATLEDNSWAHAAIATDDAGVTANQTSRNNSTGALGSGADEDFGPQTPPGAVSMSYTGVGAAATWAMLGFALLNAFDPVRDALLRAHRWTFAMTRAQLAADTTPPLFEFNQRYLLPVDLLRLDFISNFFVGLDLTNFRNQPGAEYRIEGRYLLFNLRTGPGTSPVGPLNIRYLQRVTDSTQFDPLFDEALACKLAVELSNRLTQSDGLKQVAMQEFTATLKSAIRTNAIERAPEPLPDDSWMMSRI